MPTLELKLSDFSSLLGEALSYEALDFMLMKVKGEIKEFSPEKDLLRVELNDSNRPDLWTPEGIVRQMKGARRAYSFFHNKADKTVIVSEGVEAVRPYLGACIARGLTVTEPILLQLIQSQEKLAEIFGRRRQNVSIGIYRLPEIVFPVRYEVVDPDQTSFIPLGFNHAMSLTEILTQHPKGIAYAGTLGGASRYPILVDAKDQILSFPPIINSREIGEVQVGDQALFIEVTGTDLRRVILTLNIFACSLADRGAEIEPVTIRYPKKTEFGSTIKMPFDLSESMSLSLQDFNRVLGSTLTAEEIRSSLTAYGYQIEIKGDQIIATLPPYRDDMMHPIDVIEDFVISRGYDSFIPEMPATFTVGALSRIEMFSDRLRDEMIGLGFQEAISNILSSRQEVIDRMCLEEAALSSSSVVEIGNPMSERFALLRPSLLPALLRIEAASSRAVYPHHIFEVGEVVAGQQELPKTHTHLAAMSSHPAANFSELHAVLEALLGRVGIKYSLQPITHPTFIEGRTGSVFIENVEVGTIGEIHPKVLSRWQIGMPTVAFEVRVEGLLPPCG